MKKKWFISSYYSISNVLFWILLLRCFTHIALTKSMKLFPLLVIKIVWVNKESYFFLNWQLKFLVIIHQVYNIRIKKTMGIFDLKSFYISFTNFCKISSKILYRSKWYFYQLIICWIKITLLKITASNIFL